MTTTLTLIMSTKEAKGITEAAATIEANAAAVVHPSTGSPMPPQPEMPPTILHPPRLHLPLLQERADGTVVLVTRV